MKQITNKEYEEWQKYKAEKAKGHILLLDTCPLPAKIDRKKVKKRNESQVYSVILLYAAFQSRRRFSKSRGGSQPREEWGRMVL